MTKLLRRTLLVSSTALMAITFIPVLGTIVPGPLAALVATEAQARGGDLRPGAAAAVCGRSGAMKLATFNINNVNRRLPNLLAWLEHLAHERRLSPNTLEAYGRIGRLYLAFLERHRGGPQRLADLGTVTAAEVREFHLHFTTHRPQANFHLGFLSDQWSEDDLRQQLGWLTFRCHANAPGRYLDDRSCFADIRAFNHVTAMSLSFFFADGQLNRAAVQLPSWHHEEGFHMLRRMLGKPTGAQAKFSAGVRLIGWQLADGAAVYYNRDRPLNPLERNGIFWVSARHCRASPCFSNPEPSAEAQTRKQP